MQDCAYYIYNTICTERLRQGIYTGSDGCQSAKCIIESSRVYAVESLAHYNRRRQWNRNS